MVKFKKKKIVINGNIYVAEKIIGKGQFGVIYYARSKQKTIQGKKIPKYVAIKEYFGSRFYDPTSKVNKCELYWKREVENTKIQGEFPKVKLKLIDSGIMSYGERKEYFIVLTFLDGTPFQQWFSLFQTEHLTISTEEMAFLSQVILIPLAEHLYFCHEKGLIHRDLSIENVFMIGSTEEEICPVILDWGASRLLKGSKHQQSSQNFTAFMNKGTPPEIVAGLRPEAGSDIYMFGHLMYFLFSGGKTARTPTTKEDYILKPHIENSQIPKEYDLLVQKCNQYDVNKRFKNLKMIIHALEQLKVNVPISKITHFGKHSTARLSHSPIATSSPSLKLSNKNSFLGSSSSSQNSQYLPNNKFASISQMPSIKGIRPKPLPLPIAEISPELPYIKKFKVNPTDKAVRFAKAFLAYFENPRWMYLRQDTIQIYQEFLTEVGKTLDQKDIFVRYEVIPSNIYFIGQILGSLHDLQAIIKYLKSVLQVAPNTKIVFLGNYLNYNSHDIETFTMLLSFHILFPNNVVLLRGKNEELHEMNTKGFIKHLKLKFGAYHTQIRDQFLNIIHNLDLFYIAELNLHLKCFASSGGIPLNNFSRNQVVSLRNQLPNFRSNQISRKDMNYSVQSILWGEPNELEDEIGTTSKGGFQFSWTHLTQFLKQNSLAYLFRSAAEPMGCRSIWNIVNSINSCSNFRNKLQWNSKIIRVNQKGITALNVNDLTLYFQRDYAIN